MTWYKNLEPNPKFDMPKEEFDQTLEGMYATSERKRYCC